MENAGPDVYHGDGCLAIESGHSTWSGKCSQMRAAALELSSNVDRGSDGVLAKRPILYC